MSKTKNNNACSGENKQARARQTETVIHTMCVNLKFAGAGQRDTPVTDAKGVVKTVMLLPGHHAAAARKKVAEVFVRFLGGDLSLVREVQQNRELQDLL